ncbi:hypothetical protein ACP70R_048904 [Stipagrostis hirtigluma subsp. patula]
MVAGAWAALQLAGLMALVLALWRLAWRPRAVARSFATREAGDQGAALPVPGRVPVGGEAAVGCWPERGAAPGCRLP